MQQNYFAFRVKQCVLKVSKVLGKNKNENDHNCAVRGKKKERVREI